MFERAGFAVHPAPSDTFVQSDSPEARRCLELRAQLGITGDPASPAFVTADGTPLTTDSVTRWLRMARAAATCAGSLMLWCQAQDRS